MGTKHDDTCLTKAGVDEPIFVLRSTDRIAPSVVRGWVALARAAGVSDAKCAEALQLADRMERWAAAHGGAKTPD